MAAWFFTKISTAYDTKGLEEAKKVYKKYFVTCKVVYGRYQDETDAILLAEGYGDCIVA